jgi:Protein of unknown function (DUF1569)
MKNLFDPAAAEEVKARARSLTLESLPLWGTMTPAQATEHCALALEWAVNDTAPPPGPLIARIIGRIIKPLALGNDDPMRRNSPTAKTLIIKHEPDLETAKQRLSTLIDRFTTSGPAACTANPHPFFGKITPDQWAILSYKHVDHHLRQFGV